MRFSANVENFMGVKKLKKGGQDIDGKLKKL